ncbi:unnamed protein product [Phytophthora fragariaefolia]|uniref:Unnamed protein product n=1 Tax=Phytophthora fragariaefolia TaxID=1490495 RepID=A0A9W6TKY9_9STRA|nr:unnamed protein product [Phytophthora fragariaefolia]
MQSFLAALNYYGRFVQGLAVYGAVLYQLKDEDFAPAGDLSVARGAFTALRRKVAEAQILRHFDGPKDVYIMLYANEWALSRTLMQMHDKVLHPVLFCGRILKENELNYHPAENALESQITKVVLSESRKTELKALNKIPEVLYGDEQALAETNLPAQRMQPIPQNETHAVSQTVDEPQVTAVTRNQSRRVRFAESTNHRPTSQEAVNEVDDRPADPESPISPQGGAQRSVREGTRNIETTLDEPARTDPKEASEREDPTTVQTERIRRVRVAQDEERRWVDLKAYLRGDVESLSFKRAANASNLADRFVLDENGFLQYVGKGRNPDEVGAHGPQLVLVILTTMIGEDLQSYHNSIEGGHQGITHTFHRVKKDYYWVGLYGTVTRHVRACADCSTSKGRPHLKGYSPGNVLADLLSMDFVTPRQRLGEGTHRCCCSSVRLRTR